MLTTMYSYDEYFGRNRSMYDFSIKEKEENQKKKKIFEKIIDKVCKEKYLQMIKIIYSCNKHKSKYEMLESITENIFLSQEHKNEFLRVFSVTQKTIHSLLRFLHIIKYKKAKNYNQVDLFGDPFDSIKENNRITIFENNTKYNFHSKELINIFNSALSNSVNFFSDPISCKNPYTNIPFKKSSLYNIYFKIKNSTFLMPTLLHQYFLCNFDLTKYMDENECLIRNFYIDSYISNLTSKNVYNITLCMFKEVGMKCNIHTDFPKDLLLEIMRPYIKLYYKGNYSLQENKCDENLLLLKTKLRKFVNYNPTFGRKKVLYKYNLFTKQKCIDKITFISDHIMFDKKESNEYFMKSHLENNYESNVFVYTHPHTNIYTRNESYQNISSDEESTDLFHNDEESTDSFHNFHHNSQIYESSQTLLDVYNANHANIYHLLENQVSDSNQDASSNLLHFFDEINTMISNASERDELPPYEEDKPDLDSEHAAESNIEINDNELYEEPQPESQTNQMVLDNECEEFIYYSSLS